MCGKGSSQPYMPTPYGGGMPVTSTQSVSIPPEVLARYNAVNAQAQQTAQQQFSPYAQYPSAFVSPLSQSQQAAIYNINRAQGMTEPYYQQAAQMAGASTAGAYNPAVAGISDPYYQQAARGTQAGMGQVANYGVPGISAPAYQEAAQQARYAGRDLSSAAVAQVSDPYYRQASQQRAYAARDIASGNVAALSDPYYRQSAQQAQYAGRDVASQNVARASDPYYRQAAQQGAYAGRDIASGAVAAMSDPYYRQAAQQTQYAGRDIASDAVARASDPYYQSARGLGLGASKDVASQAVAQISDPYYSRAAQQTQYAGRDIASDAVARASDPYYQSARGLGLGASKDVASQAVAQISDPYYSLAAQQAQYAGRDIASDAVARASDPYYQSARGLGLGAAQNVANQGVAQMAMPSYTQAQQLTGMGARGVADQAVAAASQPAYNIAGQMTQQAARGVADYGVASISDPAYRQAQQMTGMAGQVQVPQLSQADIQQYMSPYMQQIIDPTMKALRQQQEQAMAGQTGTAIRQGAFGGDRASLAAAQLAGQQQLAQGQTLGNLLQQGYGQALSTAQQQQQVRQAEMARVLQAGRQQADIGTMARQAYEQQQAQAQQDQARRLQAAQQYAGLGTLSREALQAQQTFAQQDAARQLQAAQQAVSTGTAMRGAYEQQQALAQTDLARQLEVAKQQQGLGTAQRQALEQQQAVAQADAARQIEASKQQQSIGTSQRQAYEQQQALAQTDLARQLEVAKQQQGLGTAQRQALEQQQAVAQADAARQLQAGQQQMGIGTAQRQAYEQQQALAQTDLARQLEVAKQQQGLGTAQRQALEQQQAIAQADAARQLQAGQQQMGIGTAQRQAYEQQQAISQADAARQLDVARQQQGLGTAARQALEQQQVVAQADAARQLDVARQQQGLGTAQRQAYEQQQAIAQADAARQLEAAQQQQGLGTAARQAYEQQQAVAQADAARQLQVAQQQMGLGTAQRQAVEQQQAIQQADLQRQLAGSQQLAGIGTQARQAAEQQQAIRQADLARTQQAAQIMGGLGTGAQQAALSAAQAQLGAGAAEQQTSQAGLQALYNQFLQQQAYPFQVSQFLANIAMGTGALSGNTTTTAQAQPFFSDRRLKEGVGAAKYGADAGQEPEVIGETFDGQKIYRYRLHNPLTGELEPPQIGLMADEAERREPEAVMQDRGTGYKMLDYKTATDDAAEIGRGLGAARMGGMVTEPGDYARGGYVVGGYVDPSDIRSILEAQAQMYAGGGGGIGGAPYTGGGGGIMAKGYVPQVELGSPKMLEPASPPPALAPKTDELQESLKKAKGISEGLESISSFGKKLLGDPLGGTHTGSYSRALGGAMPYGGDTEGYVPEEVLKKPDIEPLKAAEAPEPVTPYKQDGFLDKASGFVDTAGKLASTGSTLYGLGQAAMAILPMFSDRRLKTGVGYANGGSPEEDTIFDRMLGLESGKSQFDREGRPLTSSKGAIGIAQVMPGTAPEAAKLAGVPFDEERYRTDADYNKALGRAYFDAQVKRFGSPEIAAAAYNAGPGAVQKALARSEREGGDYLNYLPKETQKYVSGVGAHPSLGAIERGMPKDARSFLARADEGKGLGAAVPQPTTVPSVEAASEKGKDVTDFLTSKEFIIPVLTGLGAMASSPSRYLGSAIMQGVGAGAQSYMDVLGKESELAKKAAETGEIKARTGTQEQETEKRKAETLRQFQDLYKDAFFDRGGIQMVRLADGSAMSLYEWMKSPKPVWGQGAEGGMPGVSTQAGAAAKPISVAPAEVPVAPGIGFDDKSASSAKAELGMLNTPGKAALEARSAEYRSMVDKDAEIARDQKLFNNEVAGVISEMAAKTGMQAPGATGSMRAMIVNYGNTISRAAGFGDQFGSSDTAQAILEKINTLAAESRVSAAGQQALGSLQKVVGAYPNLDQPPNASTLNAASNMINNQMKLDRQQHADAYGQESGQLYSRAGVDFKRSNTPAKYKREQDALQSTMMRDPEAFAAMVSGRVSKEDIDQYFRDKAHGGITGMGRYFGD